MDRKKKATLFLIAGVFFNPLGFDVVQMILMKLTGSYYGANLALYCLAASCFGLYFFYSGNNPLIEIKSIITTIYNGRIKPIIKKNDTSKKI